LSSNSKEANIREIFKGVAEDTTYFNDFYNSGLEKEFKMWLRMFTTSPDSMVAYDKLTFDILEVSPAKIAENPDDQQKIDEKILDELHMKYKGIHTPGKKADRLVGFQNGRKEKTLEAIKRMLPFMGYYSMRLKEEGLPYSKILLPIYESGFIANSKSWASAVGIVQFTPATAKEYGLVYSSSKDDDGRNIVDLRRGYIEPFEKSLILHKKALNKFGERKGIALIAYNMGMNRSALNDISKDEIEIIKDLGFAPRSYLPEMIALVDIIANFDMYYPNENLDYDEIEVYKAKNTIVSTDFEKVTGISIEDIIELNPQYTKRFFKLPGYLVKEDRFIVLPKNLDIDKSRASTYLQKVYK
jgi:hypothetical protein